MDRQAWALAFNDSAVGWVQSYGLLMIAVLVAYFPTAMFHDITHSHHDIWLLLAMVGVAVGLGHRGYREATTALSAPAEFVSLPGKLATT